MRDEPRGTMSSIDPDALQGAADDLKRTQDGIDNDIYPLRGRFTGLSVSTAHIDQLHQAAATLDDFPSELKRRISLARAMVAAHPGEGPVAHFSSDSLGAFTTTEEAQRQAAADAAALKENGLTEEQFRNLQKYNLDPDYAEALVKAMGPGGMGELLVGQSRMSDDTDDDAHRVLGGLLATASFRVDYDKAYFDQMKKDTDLLDPVYNFSEYMTTAQFSEKSLHSIADLRFNPDSGYDGIDTTHESSINILKALTNNPRAASTYFNAHPDLMFDKIKYGDKMMYDGESQAWADYFHAATVTARNQFGIEYLDRPGDNPAIQNAQWMMKKAAGDAEDWPYTHEMRVMFAQTADEYMDDFARTIGSPIDVGKVTDPGHDGVSVSTADWQSFLKQGMRDNDGVAIIATSMQARIQSLKDATTQAEEQSPDDKGDATFWDDYTVGAMQDTFVHLYGEVGQDREDDAQDQKDSINGWIDKGLDYVTDPKGIPEDLLKTGVKSLLGLAVDASVKAEPMPDMPSGFDAKLNYADEAATRLDIADKDSDKPYGMQKYDDGRLTWDGDPTLYTEPSPPNGDFTKYNKGGHMDYDAMSKDPAAWQTFDRYLHDPAVQNSLADGYKTQLIGEGRGK